MEGYHSHASRAEFSRPSNLSALWLSRYTYLTLPTRSKSNEFDSSSTRVVFPTVSRELERVLSNWIGYKMYGIYTVYDETLGGYEI